MDNLNKEREVLAQLYSNDAEVIKYLPFFFNDMEQLERFIDTFKGKTLNIPTSYQEYVEQFLQVDDFSKDRKTRGISGVKTMKRKILESYINLFPSLEAVIKNECKDNEV